MTKWKTNPLSKDSDGDGLFDAQEVYGKTNASNSDTDGDGVNDAKDPKPTDPNVATSTAAKTTASTSTALAHQQSKNFSGLQLLLVSIIGIGVFGAAVLLWRTGHDDPNPSTSTAEGDTTAVPVTNSEEDSTDDADDILTDEGQVLKLLRDNRDRMKQVDIVEETGWSKSKVSRLLSRMEERGDVNRLRVGRGNIVYLDGAKPSGARSPHEEDSYS